MFDFVEINKDTKEVVSIFGWNDGRELPENYPIKENCIVLKVPKKLTKPLQGKWEVTKFYLKNMDAIFDSSKDYTEYFSSGTRELNTAQPSTINDLQKQVADLQNQIKEMKANG